jgi:hypothetical protein
MTSKKKKKTDEEAGATEPVGDEPYVITMDSVRQSMNILVYGPQGVGKTTMAASAQDHPDMRDVMFLNFEGGLVSIAHRGDVQALDIKHIKDLEGIFWSLVRKEYEGVRTLVIDSATEMQTLAIDASIAKRGEDRQIDVDEITLRDYGKSTAQLKRLFRWFRDLPMHVILTALPKQVIVGQDDVPAALRQPAMIKPGLTDRLSDAVMGYMDFVWYLYTREVEDEEENVVEERVLLTRSHGAVRAKTRGAHFAEALGDGVIVDPSLPKLYDLFIASQTEEK